MAEREVDDDSGDAASGRSRIGSVLSPKRRSTLKLTGGGIGALAIGGTVVDSASAASNQNNCTQVDFVTGTSTNDLDTTTYTDEGRLLSYTWAETVNNETTGEADNRTPQSDACDIQTGSGISIDFTTDTASVSYSLSNCSGDQDLMLVSYEAPCSDPSNPQWNPAQADQQAVFDTATATTQSDGSLTVDIPPTPAGAPQRSNAEAYYSLDSATATNHLTDTPAAVTDNAGNLVTDATGIENGAWKFTMDGNRSSTADALTSGSTLALNGSSATVAGWFRYSDHEDWARLWQAGGDTSTVPINDSGSRVSWELTFKNNSDEIRMYYDGATGASVTLAPNKWFFVVSVIDGNDARLHVFDETCELDGSPATGNASRDQTGSEPLVMMSGDDSEPAGRLDEVHAFSTALSEADVFRLYKSSTDISSQVQTGQDPIDPSLEPIPKNLSYEYYSGVTSLSNLDSEQSTQSDDLNFIRSDVSGCTGPGAFRFDGEIPIGNRLPSGDYTFTADSSLVSNGQIKAYVDSSELSLSGGATTALSSGTHDFRVEFYQEDPGTQVGIGWEGTYGELLPRIAESDPVRDNFSDNDGFSSSVTFSNYDQAYELEARRQTNSKRIDMPESGSADSKRSLALGMPSYRNACFDPNTATVRYGWIGAFLDYGPMIAYGSGRGDDPGQPLGKRFAVAGTDYPLRFGDQNTQPTVEFEGYRQNVEPELYYTVDGKSVTQIIKSPPGTPGLRYTFTFDSTVTDTIYFLTAQNSDINRSASVGTWNGDTLEITSDVDTFTVTLVDTGVGT